MLAEEYTNLQRPASIARLFLTASGACADGMHERGA